MRGISSGNRLSTPETRLKPEIAGVDGVITTFFAPPGYYNYPYAFFGTSAAGPSVAGVIALMEQAAGFCLGRDGLPGRGHIAWPRPPLLLLGKFAGTMQLRCHEMLLREIRRRADFGCHLFRVSLMSSGKFP
jgi:hypothetical protein